MPALIGVAVEPLTVQTEVVVDVKFTSKPELAVALSSNGEAVSAAAPGAVNVIVCVP